MNVAAAESLDFISDRLEKFSGDSVTFDAELQKLLSELVTSHKRIIFNGNNYSKEWLVEAEKRGLPNLQTSLQALTPLLNPRNHQLFEKYGVFNCIELESRYEISVDEYLHKIQIEGELSQTMAQNTILPVVLEEYALLVATLKNVRDSGVTAGQVALTKQVEQIGALADQVQAKISELDAIKTVNVDNCALYIKTTRELRAAVDELETLVDDRKWPLPKYQEMLFLF